MSHAGMLLFKLTVPFLLLGGYCLLMYAALPYEVYVALMGMMFIYFIPPAGKESVIPIGISLGIPWWILAFSLALTDILSTLFMLLNFDLALKIPVLGDRFMKSFMEHGETFFHKHRWVERLSTIGLGIVVMVPMQGTGGVATPILGRIIGMTPQKIFIAVVSGSLFGCYAIAIGTEYIRQLFLIDIKYGAAAVLILIIAIISGYILWNKKQRKLKEKSPKSNIFQ
ncbi:small multi-drug export protein [Methanochimaera problematica]|nr:small multi-drug export protein [Methanoplanus sp. FWC-SCC4]